MKQTKRNNSKSSTRRAPRNKGAESAQRSVNQAERKCDAKRESYDDIKSNDISWYNNSILYEDATKIPFNLIAGAEYPVGLIGSDPDATVFIATPAMMRLPFIPWIGSANDASDPINRAFTKLYGYLASKTTGAMQFQQADLAMLVISMSSIASGIGHLKRCLEMANLYSGVNYYMPRDLIDCVTNGVGQGKYIIDNRNEFRMRLNSLIDQFNQIKVPLFVKTFAQQYAHAHNLYADEDSQSAQFFAFVPVGLWHYVDAGTPETTGTLQFVPYDDSVHIRQGEETYSRSYLRATWDKVYTVVENELLNWLHSSDLPLIAGALQRAYADAAFVTLDHVFEDSINVPVYDRNILWQINNSRAFPWKVADITQDAVKDTIVSSAYIQFGDSEANYDLLTRRGWWSLNTYDANMTPEFAMESTRLIGAVGIPPVLPVEQAVTVGYAEVVARSTILLLENAYYYVSTKASDATQRVLRYDHCDTFTRFTDVNQHLLWSVSKFRNHPRYPLFTWKSSNAVGKRLLSFIGDYGDLSWHTRINQDQLEALDEAALLSLYNTDTVQLRI